MTFDLTEEPWIPVARGGEVVEVSLVDALVASASTNSIAASPPTMGVALLRLLLAVALDALGAPRSHEDWADQWERGGLDADAIRSYLAEHRDRFDLFSPTAPFAQVAGLETAAGKVSPSSLIIPSVPVGNAVPIFGARTEDDPVALTPSAAARWVVHLDAWDTAGIKSGAVGDAEAKGGKTYGNPVGPLGLLGVVVPIGRTLFETLVLNLPVTDDGLDPDDRPAWRRPPPGPSWSTRAPVGLLDLLTWPSRRVRLFPEDDGGKTVVRHVVVASGDRMISVPDFEPHTLWRVPKVSKPDERPQRPRRHAGGKAAWQGLDALLALEADVATTEVCTSRALAQIGDLQAHGILESFPLNVEIVGCEYGTQSAVVDNVVADVLPLPVAALRADSEVGELVRDIARSADGLVDAINLLDGDLRRASGGEPTPWNSGQRPGARLIHQLDPHVRRLLAGLQRDPDRTDGARQVWREVAWSAVSALAEELLRDVSPAARTGREATVGGKERTFRSASAELSFRRRRSMALEDFVDDLPSAKEATV